MDIYDFAMRIERDGEKYYRELAAGTTNKGLRTILTYLADEEVRHYEIFERMKRNEKAKLNATDLLARTKNIFELMREEGETADITGSQIDLYKKAQEIEKKSEDAYLQDADQVKDAHQREIFLKIAKEERNHYNILENIINFVSRPQQWLENAEWHHLEAY